MGFEAADEYHKRREEVVVGRTPLPVVSAAVEVGKNHMGLPCHSNLGLLGTEEEAGNLGGRDSRRYYQVLRRQSLRKRRNP